MPVPARLLFALLLTSCTTTPDPQTETTGADSTGSESGGIEVPDATACDAEPSARLFGSPTPNTGLGADACGPSCNCAGGEWTPPTYDDAFADRLDTLALENPPELLDEDPYVSDPGLTPDPNVVCGAVIDESSYRLDTYADETAAADAGAWVTHRGACGQCSSLANLAVYMRRADLTDPVRQCGVEGLTGTEAENIACLMELGFDEACAQTWYFNTAHTRDACLDVCLAELDNPNHLPDGSLNPCIQCDEDESGDVFKAVSGRTRRNSGLPSALCRPCDSVYRVTHDYGL